MGLFTKLLEKGLSKKEYVRYRSYSSFKGYLDDFVLYKVLNTKLTVLNTEFDYTQFTRDDYKFDLTIPVDNKIYGELNGYVNNETYKIIPMVKEAREEDNFVNIDIAVYKRISDIDPGKDQESIDLLLRGSKEIVLDYVYESIPSYKIELKDNFVRTEYEKEIKLSGITSKTDYRKIDDFVVIDLETTGLHNSSSIVELSAIKFRDFRPIEKFNTLINPKRKIPSAATEVNHITDEMVKGQPTIEEVLPSFMSFVGDDNIVGHNLDFDLGILEYRGVCFNGKRKFYDTLLISQRHLRKARKKWDKEYQCYEIDYDHDYDVENHKLDTVCEYYGINRFNSHRGGVDCLATGILFKRFADEITDVID